MRWSFRSFAKVNLHLQVVARRADGYHDLLTVFQTIDLADELSLEPIAGSGIELVLSGAGAGSGLGVGSENLARRAAEAFFAAFPLAALPGGGRGLRIGLEKRIPIGAGLGGGSSNAAAALLALRDLTGVPEDAGGLESLARRLGADVPFFLHGGTALGKGRGDEIEPWPDLAAAEEFLLAVPGIHLSTADVFAALPPPVSRPLPEAFAAVARVGVHGCLADLPAWNDLEATAVALRPELAGMYALLVNAGAQTVRMTGSGSCFMGFLPRHETAGSRRSRRDERVLTVRTLSRHAYQARRRVTSSA